MDESLLDIACRSDKRKGLLLYLLEGPHTLEEIKKTLHVTATGMLPQIKILKENRFVEQESEYYKLSLLGRIAATKLNSFLDITETLDRNYEYWTSRRISAIPPELQKKLGMLRDCEIISPDIDNLFEPPKEIVELLFKAKNLCVVIPYYHPFYISFFDSYIADRKPFTGIIFETEIFQEKSGDNFKFALDNANVYLSDIPFPVSYLLVSDKFVLFILLNSNGEYDGFILCGQSPEAIEWGKDFFEYYKAHSHRITSKDLEW